MFDNNIAFNVTRYDILSSNILKLYTFVILCNGCTLIRPLYCDMRYSDTELTLPEHKAVSENFFGQPMKVLDGTFFHTWLCIFSLSNLWKEVDKPYFKVTKKYQAVFSS